MTQRSDPIAEAAQIPPFPIYNASGLARNSLTVSLASELRDIHQDQGGRFRPRLHGRKLSSGIPWPLSRVPEHPSRLRPCPW